ANRRRVNRAFSPKMAQSLLTARQERVFLGWREPTMTLLKKAVLAGALGASALTVASPAMADDWRWRRHHGGDEAGAAVAGGIIGLALGAAIASGSRDRYYDDDYYYRHHRPR